MPFNEDRPTVQSAPQLGADTDQVLLEALSIAAPAFARPRRSAALARAHRPRVPLANVTVGLSAIRLRSTLATRYPTGGAADEVHW